MQTILMKIVLFGLSMSLCACSGHMSPAILESAGAIEAKVVDAGTGLPIEGANVVALYQSVKKTLGGRGERSVLEVMETVTDAQGRLTFPAVTLAKISLDEIIEGDDPAVLVFKPGYEHQFIRRAISNGYPNGVRGVTLKLKRYPVEPEKSEPNFSYYFGIKSDLSNAIDSCQWEKFPKALLAMDSEQRRVLAINPKARINLPTILHLENTSKQRENPCRSAEEFFKRFVK
jgi:hypothetical protein